MSSTVSEITFAPFSGKTFCNCNKKSCIQNFFLKISPPNLPVAPWAPTKPVAPQALNKKI